MVTANPIARRRKTGAIDSKSVRPRRARLVDEVLAPPSPQSDRDEVDRR
jgi:hypothetical protein